MQRYWIILVFIKKALNNVIIGIIYKVPNNQKLFLNPILLKICLQTFTIVILIMKIMKIKF